MYDNTQCVLDFVAFSPFQLLPIYQGLSPSLSQSEDGSDRRAAASYLADPGSNPAVSGSNEIALKRAIFCITLVINDHGRM